MKTLIKNCLEKVEQEERLEFERVIREDRLRNKLKSDNFYFLLAERDKKIAKLEAENLQLKELAKIPVNKEY